MISFILILVVLLVLGGAIRGLEWAIERDMRALDYDQRWSDQGYVKMVHETRTKEAALGFDLTECECDFHKPSVVKHPIRDAPRKNRGVVQDPFDNAGGYRIDAAGPGFIQFKISQEVYDRLPGTRHWGKPDQYMGLKVIDVKRDLYNGIVYIRCEPVERAGTIITGNSILTSPILTSNEKRYSVNAIKDNSPMKVCMLCGEWTQFGKTHGRCAAQKKGYPV